MSGDRGWDPLDGPRPNHGVSSPLDTYQFRLVTITLELPTRWTGPEQPPCTMTISEAGKGEIADRVLVRRHMIGKAIEVFI